MNGRLKKMKRMKYIYRLGRPLGLGTVHQSIPTPPLISYVHCDPLHPFPPHAASSVVCFLTLCHQTWLKVLEESYPSPLEEIPGDTSRFKAIYQHQSHHGCPLRDLISISLPRILHQYQSPYQPLHEPQRDLIRMELFPIM